MGVFASKDQDKRLPSPFDCEKMHGQDDSTKTYNYEDFIIIVLWGSKWIESWIKLGAGNSSCPAESRTLQFGPMNSPLEKQLP